jgi:hypothetical protein
MIFYSEGLEALVSFKPGYTCRITVFETMRDKQPG